MKYWKGYFFGGVMFGMGSLVGINFALIRETAYEPSWFNIWVSLAFAIAYPYFFASWIKE